MAKQLIIFPMENKGKINLVVVRYLLLNSGSRWNFQKSALNQYRPVSLFCNRSNQDMGIFEQVDKIIKDLEVRERKNQTGRLLDEGLILEEMSKRYRQCIEKGQWNDAHNYLENITRLAVAILTE
jgi:hypothetical protein